MTKLTGTSTEPTAPTTAEINAMIERIECISRPDDMLDACIEFVENMTVYYAASVDQLRRVDKAADCARAMMRGDDRELQNIHGIYR